MKKKIQISKNFKFWAIEYQEKGKTSPFVFQISLIQKPNENKVRDAFAALQKTKE